MKSYNVKKSAIPIALDAGWNSAMWENAEIANINYSFENNTSGFIPEVQIKMLHDNKRICGLFQVKDQYVIARKTADQQMVCEDSCVEFFVKPATDKCYFNFEIN